MDSFRLLNKFKKSITGKRRPGDVIQVVLIDINMMASTVMSTNVVLIRNESKPMFSNISNSRDCDVAYVNRVLFVFNFFMNLMNSTSHFFTKLSAFS